MGSGLSVVKWEWRGRGGTHCCGGYHISRPKDFPNGVGVVVYKHSVYYSRGYSHKVSKALGVGIRNYLQPQTEVTT